MLFRSVRSRSSFPAGWALWMRGMCPHYSCMDYKMQQSLAPHSSSSNVRKNCSGSSSGCCSHSSSAKMIWPLRSVLLLSHIQNILFKHIRNTDSQSIRKYIKWIECSREYSFGPEVLTDLCQRACREKKSRSHLGNPA